MAHVFLHRPRDFNPKVEVSGVCCEFNDLILLLRRHADKVEGLSWGLPAGKVESNESPLDAAIRELHEEAGVRSSPSEIKKITSFFVRRPEFDFIFHMYYLPLLEMPILNISPVEHIDSCWVNLQDGLKLPLISGGSEALEYFFLWKNDQKIQRH